MCHVVTRACCSRYYGVVGDGARATQCLQRAVALDGATTAGGGFGEEAARVLCDAYLVSGQVRRALRGVIVTALDGLLSCAACAGDFGVRKCDRP